MFINIFFNLFFLLLFLILIVNFSSGPPYVNNFSRLYWFIFIIGFCLMLVFILWYFALFCPSLIISFTCRLLNELDFLLFFSITTSLLLIVLFALRLFRLFMFKNFSFLFFLLLELFLFFPIIILVFMGISLIWGSFGIFSISIEEEEEEEDNWDSLLISKIFDLFKRSVLNILFGIPLLKLFVFLGDSIFSFVWISLLEFSFLIGGIRRWWYIILTYFKTNGCWYISFNLILLLTSFSSNFEIKSWHSFDISFLNESFFEIILFSTVLKFKSFCTKGLNEWINSYNKIPKDHISIEYPYPLLFIISGAIYSTVPQNVPLFVFFK